MEKYEIEEYNEDSILVNQMTKFEEVLAKNGLPSKNIIASVSERKKIMGALPAALGEISIEEKKDATYLSKFVACAVIGMFDASLNFLWNEVVVNLRKKIVSYGLEEFFDAAVDQKRREDYTSENDLPGIKDITLLNTCKKLEWISDIVHRKLCHILDMRNQIGASHPTTYSINSYELLGWMQICVEDVLSDKPSKNAIEVKKLLENVKKRTSLLDESLLNSFELSIRDLSSSMASNLITSLFGIFVSDKSSTIVKNNVLKVAKIVWKYCKDGVKYDLGEKIDMYKNNLDEDKVNLAKSFFEECGGLEYLSLNTRTLQLSFLCDRLMAAHIGHDNYYNEPSYAREIMNYIKVSDNIPDEREEKLIDTFLICRIGREVTYCNGVSPSAKGCYDDFFSILSKEQIIIMLNLLKKHLDSIYNGAGIKCENAGTILRMIKSPLLGDRLNEIIEFMLRFHEKKILNKVYKDKEFKDLSRGILDWE